MVPNDAQTRLSLDLIAVPFKLRLSSMLENQIMGMGPDAGKHLLREAIYNFVGSDFGIMDKAIAS